MRKEAKILHQMVKDLYMELTPLLTKLAVDSNADHLNVREHLDTAYACRETKNLLDELKKKINALEAGVSTLGSQVLMMDGEKNFSTDYCTGTVNPRQWFKFPYKREGNEEEFDRIMQLIGVGEIARKLELVRLHPPEFVDFCTKMQEHAPVDSDKIVSTEFRFRIRKKKEIDAVSDV